MKNRSISLPPRAIVFDLDGTLVDSAPDLQVALNEVLNEAGWPSLDLDTVTSMMGDGVDKFVERGVSHAGGDLASGDLPDLIGRFLERYAQHPTRFTKPYPGVAETLSRMRQADYALGVCTNKNHDLSVTILREFGLDGYLGAVIGGDSLDKRKPDPEPLLATLAELGVQPSSAVMVGDSRNDVAVARRAGIPAIVVSYGYCPDGADRLGADITIDKFADLPDALIILTT